LDENDDAQGGDDDGDDDDGWHGDDCGHDEVGGKAAECDDNSRTDEAEVSPRPLQLVGCNDVRIVVGAAYIKHFTCDVCPAPAPPSIPPPPIFLWSRHGHGRGRVPWAIVELEPETSDESESGVGGLMSVSGFGFRFLTPICQPSRAVWLARKVK